MGMFSEKPGAEYPKMYENIQPFLLPQTGKSHVAIFSVTSIKLSGCVADMTNQINYVLTRMQDEGYEIIDIKPIIETFSGPHSVSYMVQITYK